MDNFTYAAFRKFLFSDRCTEHFAFLSRKEIVSLLTDPLRMEAFMCLTCIEGHLEIIADLQVHSLHTGSLFLYLNSGLVQLKSCSEDTKCEAIVIDNEYLDEITKDKEILFLKNRNTKVNIDHHLSSHMVGNILLFQQILSSETLDSEMSYCQTMVDTLMICYLERINQIIAEKDREINLKKFHQHLPYERFIRKLTQEYPPKRKTKYYAQEIAVVNDYLPKLVLRQTNRSIREIIGEYVTMEAKFLLHYKKLNTNTVVNRLNFPSSSAFRKYFMTYAGISLKEYKSKKG